MNTQPVTSTERVYEAVRELRAQEQIATRETVADLTGLKLQIVDDRLRTLVDDGRLKRLLRGIYEMVEIYPPTRAISKTVLSNGWVKYEMGDEVFTLSPTEDRVLAMLTAGAATQAAAIESGRQHLFLATELAARLEKLQQEMKALRAARSGAQQRDLLEH
jgi:hypothetical protein